MVSVLCVVITVKILPTLFDDCTKSTNYVYLDYITGNYTLVGK
jgi:hypothetical protein